MKQLSADAGGLKDIAVSMPQGLVDDATIIIKNHPINILANVIEGDYNAVAYNYGAFLSVGPLYIGGPPAAGRKAATAPLVRSAATTTAKETTKEVVKGGVKKTAVQPSNLASASGGAAGKGAAKTAPHGNSKLSPNPQHRYEIVENSSGDVVKTGISGRPLNRNGTSSRANAQVRQLNTAEGRGTYSARVVETNLPGR